MFGGDGPGPSTAILRIVADHPDQAGAQLLVREQGSAISHMSAGTTLGLGTAVRPGQHIAGFLIPKTIVGQRATVDGDDISVSVATDAIAATGPANVSRLPQGPIDVDPSHSVPSIEFAFARSGDKGNLSNVAVIARRPEYLPAYLE